MYKAISLILIILSITAVGSYFFIIKNELNNNKVSYAFNHESKQRFLNYYIKTADFDYNYTEASGEFNITKDSQTITLNNFTIKPFISDWVKVQGNAVKQAILPPKDCNFLKITIRESINSRNLNDRLYSINCMADINPITETLYTK